MKTWIVYSLDEETIQGEETIQVRKLYEEIRYFYGFNVFLMYSWDMQSQAAISTKTSITNWALDRLLPLMYRFNMCLLVSAAARNLGVQLTLLQPGGQIMPTTLLLAHPDLKTQRHLC